MIFYTITTKCWVFWFTKLIFQSRLKTASNSNLFHHHQSPPHWLSLAALAGRHHVWAFHYRCHLIFFDESLFFNVLTIICEFSELKTSPWNRFCVSKNVFFKSRKGFSLWWNEILKKQNNKSFLLERLESTNTYRIHLLDFLNTMQTNTVALLFN